MLSFIAVLVGNALEGQVIGLGAAGGEYDLPGFGSQEGGHLLPGVLQSLFGLQAIAVQAGGVAEFFGEIGQHGLQDLWIEGSGGGVVHVNALHCWNLGDAWVNSWRRGGRDRALCVLWFFSDFCGQGILDSKYATGAAATFTTKAQSHKGRTKREFSYCLCKSSLRFYCLCGGRS